ncbi:MAG TPA: hypothetical protein PKA74_11355 [Bauldia sp.]|nr:hypothetical protein [Bauldia sp.]
MRAPDGRKGNTWRGDPVAKRGFAIWIAVWAVLVLVLGVSQGVSGRTTDKSSLDPAFTASVKAAPPTR